MADTKDLKVKEKQELQTSVEQTKPGLVFTPDVDIFESEREITLLADMPGVTSESITIDLNEGVLTLTGDVKPWENADEADVLLTRSHQGLEDLKSGNIIGSLQSPI